MFRQLKSFIILLLLWMMLTPQNLLAQTVISGKITDKDTGEPLIGVNIKIKDKQVGTITDYDGTYKLTTQTPPPFVLIYSIVGYATREITIDKPQEKIDLEMETQVLFGREIVVSASRVEEDILTSPVSIEKLSLLDIQQGAASNFYDELYKIKGVDMNVNSLTFRFPNVRGFNGEANYRMNQLVDGISNISPGLSFSAGNIFGISQLDLESVELLVGASSALYGPGGMNGTLLMTSKNPFDYQGLSVSAQMGIMHVNASYQDMPKPMYDLSLRYAKAFNDKWAFKIVADYLTAEDWNASDFRDRGDLNDPESTRENNEGYDGVNVYGDDIIVPVNLLDVAPAVAEGVCENQGLTPGTPEYDQLYNHVVSLFPDQLVTRTGWKERDLAGTHTDNLKLSAAVHHRINDNLEAIIQGTYSNGNSVYTTQNRFAIRNFRIGMGKVELKSKNFFVRAWGIAENSANSYDIGGAALRLNEAWKSSEDWYSDYIASFTQTRLLGGSLKDSYSFARLTADNRDRHGNVFDPSKPAIPLPGSEELKTYWDEIISKQVTEGGAGVLDKSSLYQIEGQYNFTDLIKSFELMVGVSNRVYVVNSSGNIFFDKPGEPIPINEFGAYAQISKPFIHDRFRLTASARYDKNQNFKGRVTPRFSAVWALDPDKNHNIRASYQTAFRFPSISDQWVDFDIGYYRAIGGLPEVQNYYHFNTNPVYPLSGSNPILDTPVTDKGPFIIPTFSPERVEAIELGYKGLSFNNMLYMDAYVFKNKYNGFLYQQLLAQNPNTPEEQRYQTTISTNEPVSAFGWAISMDLKMMMGFHLGGNVAYNTLLDKIESEGHQTRFNTPDYRYNLSFGNRGLLKNVGFNINFRWQNKFLWESGFGVAEMPAFSTLDAQVNYKWSKMKTIIKIGGSNLLNNYYTTSFGSAQIGGLYYIKVTFNEFLN